jgi:uncharacterized cupredoxin-like copper-binding protein
MRTGALICTLAASLCVPSPASPQQLRGDAAETITIRLSNFAFTPNQLSLRMGVPVDLHLVNEAGGGHDFSAPAFFAASAFPKGASPQGGKIDVPANGSADVTLIPRAPGTYKFECTHFLHSLFGMTGTIVVTPAS